MSIYQKLMEIQSGIKVPKGQFNTFGNYSYRSCEDILEAVKPLLKTKGLALNIFDSIELIGQRYYVKATAVIIDTEDASTVEAVAYAREDETKKGMDSSQITGSTSSYARKYALNGLFCIDDVKDADTQDNRKPEPQKQAQDKKGDTAVLQCSKCKVAIPKGVYSFSVNKFKKPLCQECQKEAN